MGTFKAEQRLYDPWSPDFTGDIVRMGTMGNMSTMSNIGTMGTMGNIGTMGNHIQIIELFFELAKKCNRPTPFHITITKYEKGLLGEVNFSSSFPETTVSNDKQNENENA